ncbi:hypothetical protein CY34DRAFT_809828 [Suillus luteus UH-Slu-Lm8-n1]|uniref:Unplaced genomic scaffold CY34scaffold_288, whole genome shotgun sequence n=1 Tax=Suillus luteus UH-Slu-Lm8-n1 TaxID=930992 RepID=A0A0C9ZKH9_9AGAM|nr:hypothetical protein CY34DRAFT_809828 [Suillus luteus UH-Slu-Lm8-n1]
MGASPQAAAMLIASTPWRNYSCLPGLVLHTIRFTWKYSTYAYSIYNYHIRFTGIMISQED